MKYCNKCGNWKDTIDFFRDKSKKDGKSTICKECRKNTNKIYYEKNKEYVLYKTRSNWKRYYKENKEYILEKNKKYFENNPTKRCEIIKKSNKKYYNSPMSFDSKSKIRKEIKLYEEVKKSTRGYLMCKCAYCGEWFEPTHLQIQSRVAAINNSIGWECRLYCSDRCKDNCPIYLQRIYPKDHKPATSREVQPELRKMVFARDNYTCQKCNTHRDNLEVGIHCHHIEGIQWEPLQSADTDMCITFCADCHNKVHQIPGCGRHDMKCA